MSLSNWFSRFVVIVLPIRAAHADPEIAPNLYERGNLRVSVACAEAMATPERGLRLTLDGTGSPIKPLGINAFTGVALDSDDAPVLISAPTDVGFLAPPGRHHVRIDADGCAPGERDIEISPTHAEYVRGRLAVGDGDLAGPVGAPDGFGFVLGGFTSSYPKALSSGVDGGGLWSTAYDVTAATVQGVAFSASYERRNRVIAIDETMGWGSIAGTVRSVPGPSSSGMYAPGPFPFTGSFMQNSVTLRLGARLPMNHVALAAGSGLGASLWITTGGKVDPGSTPDFQVLAHAPEGPSLLWHVPLWASATIKPSCDWGVQALASYDVEPTNFDGNALVLSAGVMWQPAASCREAAGLDVSP